MRSHEPLYTVHKEGYVRATGALFRPRLKRDALTLKGNYDYDVIGTDGTVIGRIFVATTSPTGTPWMWAIAYGDREDRTPTHGYEATRQAAMRAFARSQSSAGLA